MSGQILMDQNELSSIEKVKNVTKSHPTQVIRYTADDEALRAVPGTLPHPNGVISSA